MKIVSERLFEVIPESKTYNAIHQYLDAHVEASEAWTSFCEKYGATEYMAADSLQGLLFERNQQPDGWINPANVGHSRVFRPSFRDTKCSEAAKEFKALPSKPSMFRWLDMLEIPIMVGDNRRSFKSPGFKNIAGTYYLTATEGCAVPDDVVEVSGAKAEKLQEIEEREAA